MISDSSNLGGYFTRINNGLTVYIYALTDPSTGEIRYVGKTINPKYRLSVHIADRRKCHKTRWIQGMLRDGRKPVLELLEVLTGVTDDQWQEVERFWIAYLRFIGCALTNLEAGGNRGRRHGAETRQKITKALIGRVVSEVTRAKIRDAQIGKKRGPMSEEHKAKISASNKGKGVKPKQPKKAKPRPPMSAETKLKISRAITGRKVTTQTRRRLSLSHRGQRRPLSEETKRKIALQKIGRPRSNATKQKLSISHRVRNLNQMEFTQATLL